jgi:hypothetical protein
VWSTMAPTTKEKKTAAAMLLLLNLRDHDMQMLEARALLLAGAGRRRRRKKERTLWVRSWLSEERRMKYGHYDTLLKELREEDPKGFFNYTRLTLDVYDEILARIEGRLVKKDTWYRRSISPGLKISLVLRHLASGDDYVSLCYNFRVAPNTISLIVIEVCDAIKAEFASECIQCPVTEAEWLEIAKEYEKKWHLPHPLGALDGKHIAIRQPWGSGSTYRNYKGFFSIVLMALVDADYKFLWVDVGAEGMMSDAQIYNASELKECLDSKDNVLNMPAPSPLPGDDVDVPYFIIGDNAFGIQPYLMNPYPIRDMTYEERIYNYRLSRARRVVENAFGIMANKFRVLLGTMAQSPDTVRKIVTTCVILHNLMRMRYPQLTTCTVDLEDRSSGKVIPGSWRTDAVLVDVNREKRARNVGSKEGRQVRRYLSHWVTSDVGSVPWQDNMI